LALTHVVLCFLLFLSFQLFLCHWFLHPHVGVDFLLHKFNTDPLYKCLYNTREKALLNKLNNAVEKQDGDAFDQAIAQYDPNGALDDASHHLLIKIKADKIRAVASAQNAQEQVNQPKPTLADWIPLSAGWKSFRSNGAWIFEHGGAALQRLLEFVGPNTSRRQAAVAPPGGAPMLEAEESSHDGPPEEHSLV
jgi:hypothetical protein